MAPPKEPAARRSPDAEEVAAATDAEVVAEVVPEVVPETDVPAELAEVLDEVAPSDPQPLRLGEGGDPFIGIPRLAIHPSVRPGHAYFFVGAEADALVATGVIIPVA